MYILNDLKIQLNPETVLDAMDCKKDSPIYSEILDEFEEIRDEAFSLMHGVGIIGFGELSELTKTEKYPQGSRVLYAVLSVGDGIKQRSSRAFDEGDYVKGLMYDVIADCALFSLEVGLKSKIEEICNEHNIGISARLEAPHDISMEVQKEAWQTLDLKNTLGIDITSGYMLDPVKTSCQVFVITDDTRQRKIGHDCRNCSNVVCKFRNVPPSEITVLENNTETVFLLDDKESLMDGLIREGFYVSAVCGGKGRCGKCKVKVLQDNVPISAEDKTVFTEQEIADGWRLSCTLYPKYDIKIEFDLNDEQSFEVVTDYTSQTHSEDIKDGEYNIAIDIGTTTIAFQLLKNGEVCHTVTAINKQRKYGADVISRIKASTEGKSDELKASIETDLRNGITQLVNEYGVTADRIKEIVIAANTTMTHLLMGYDCTTLGQYPFTPVNIDYINDNAQSLIGTDAKLAILPGISTYVGGDIVSGLYECGFHKSDEVCILIDLGTNGEMAIGNRDKILVTSTAAGPAFEGGNIKWGMGSVDGAVCSVTIENVKAAVQTINNKPPVGICGTGVVEITAELLKEEIVDETGLLSEEYFNNGYPIAKTTDGQQIVFTQKDVREIQLAKAAIRAGVETLIHRYRVDKNEISRVYIAGGFGYRLDVQKAIVIGMIPSEFKNRIEAVGNSSLAGAVRCIKSKKSIEDLNSIVNISEEISLSTDGYFSDAYMEAMMFDGI